MRTLSLALIASVSLGLATASATAQGVPAASLVSESIEVRVLNVEVMVSDRRGRPVAGLGPADFEVLVDGEAVEIVNFFADQERSEVPPSSGVPPMAAERRPLQLAILVDSSNVEVRARNKALERVGAFLRTELGPDNRVMLVSVPPVRDLLAAGPDAFTQEVDLVIQALDEIAATPSQDRRLVEFREILQDIGASLSASTASVQGRMRNLEARIRAFSAETSRDTARTAADLRQLVRRLAGLPGRKAILYLGGGLSLRPGEALFGAMSEALSRYVTQLPEGTPVPDLPSRSHDDDSGELLKLARYASVRGVAFYSVALGESTPTASFNLSRGSIEAGAGSGPGQEESWAPAVGVSRQFDLESSLQLLAGATGGLSSAGRGLSRLLDRLGDDVRTFYSLGIRPPEGAAGSEHRLQVRVRGRGREVRHRETLRTAGGDEEAAARTLSALWGGPVENSLGVQLIAGAPRSTGKDVYVVPVSVQLPLASLVLVPKDSAVHAGQVSLFFAVGSAEAEVPVKKAVLPITVPNAEIEAAKGQMADYRLELEMPAGPGRIAVGVRDDLDPRLSTQFMDLVVEDPGLAAEPAAVASRSLTRPVAPPVEGDPEPESVQERRKGLKYRLPRDETERAYRKALSLLAGGELEGAQQALRDLEAVAARRAVYDQLEKIESQVLLRLSKKSPSVLLPVAWLHAELISIYRREAHGPLAEHARRMSTRLARSVVRQGSSADVRSAAGGLLTELAGSLLRAGRLGEAQQLFESALQSDEGNAVARVGLGVSHEWRGRYEEAAEVLEPFSESADQIEARLRLALCLERLGKTARSRPLLETLIVATPDWVAVIAVQESVRIAISEERYDRASDILGRALKRWPEHHGLRVQQAYLSDRDGAPRRAREQVGRLIAVADGAPSPRDRYNRWPVSEVARQELREDVGKWLDELGGALRGSAR